MARLIYSIYFGPPQGAPHIDFDAVFASLLSDLVALLEQGQIAGELPHLDRHDTAWLVLSLLNTAMEEQLCHEQHPRLDRTSLQRLLTLLFRGFAHAQH